MASEILAVIPVSGRDPEFRHGIPRLAGRSLLDYTFEAARASTLLGRTIVATDDRRIAEASRRAGIEVPFVREATARRQPMAEVLLQAVTRVESAEPDYRPAWVVRLQVTYPLRDAGLIDRAIRTVLTEDLDSAFTAFPEYDTFWYTSEDGVPRRITTDTRVPRADRTPIYRELGGLFSMVRRTVLQAGRLHGDRLGIIPIESVISAIDIHSVHGLDLAALAAASRRAAPDAPPAPGRRAARTRISS